MNKRLEYVRKKIMKLTQQKFADELGIDRTSLSNYERGKTEIPLYIAKLIAARYLISEKWLLTGEGSVVEYPVREESFSGNTRDETKLLRIEANINAMLKETNILDEKIKVLDEALDRLDEGERRILIDSFLSIIRLKTT